VSFALSPIDDIFELRVPRLQITRKTGDKALAAATGDKGAENKSVRSSIAKSEISSLDSASVGDSIRDGTKGVDEERRALRREIKAWWEGVADHMDKLETTIVGSTLVGFRKALPRLPSVDDAYEEVDSASEDDGEEDDESEALSTPKTPRPPNNHLIVGLPPSAPTTPQIARSAQEFFPTAPPPIVRASTDPTVSPPPAPPPLPTGDSLELLTSLRQTFHGTEQGLYAQLAGTPVSALNDVRRAFVAAAKGTEKRLAAWQKKHLPGPARGKSKRGLPRMEMAMEGREPEWWAKGCHTAPGGNIIIREDDWGSIIAFTMR
jgi:1-phosphatidylinositol-3-phosphate 5-kinase